MQVVQSPRASAILYNLLKSRADIRPWLLPANICPIVPITFLKAGVPFDLVDISAGTLHMDLDQAETLIATRKYGGVLYAHTYGESSTPEAFFHQIKRVDESLLIVDDRCLCIPDLQARVDSAADVQLYSTGYAKIVDLGIGGYAFLRDGVLYESAHLFFDAQAHEQVETQYKRAIQDAVPFEYEDCNWLQTEAVLPSWEEYSACIEERLVFSMSQRSRLNQIYTSRLPRELQLLNEYQMWRFNILIKNKQRILNKIFEAGLFASSHYASLAGIMADGTCPHAEALHDSALNLFNDHHFDEMKAEKICDVILQNLS
jgi:Predicted pyridoxal phosphate-dependent enzyme apparently involved in regulation of cell wall biogenesis